MTETAARITMNLNENADFAKGIPVLQSRAVNGRRETVWSELWECYPILDELYTCYTAVPYTEGTET